TTSPLGVRVSAFAPTGASNHTDKEPSAATRRIWPVWLLVNSTVPSPSRTGPSTASRPSLITSIGVPWTTTPDIAGVTAGGASAAVPDIQAEQRTVSNGS